MAAGCGLAWEKMTRLAGSVVMVERGTQGGLVGLASVVLSPARIDAARGGADESRGGNLDDQSLAFGWNSTLRYSGTLTTTFDPPAGEENGRLGRRFLGRRVDPEPLDNMSKGDTPRRADLGLALFTLKS
jgi:hypothetical protein